MIKHFELHKIYLSTKFIQKQNHKQLVLVENMDFSALLTIQ